MHLERLIKPENDTLVRLRLMLYFCNVADVFHCLIVLFMFIRCSILNVLITPEVRADIDRLCQCQHPAEINIPFSRHIDPSRYIHLRQLREQVEITRHKHHLCCQRTNPEKQRRIASKHRASISQAGHRSCRARFDN